MNLSTTLQTTMLTFPLSDLPAYAGSSMTYVEDFRLSTPDSER